MNVKISEKDKVLLVVLAIIIVVFAAVMFPKYGIKSLIEKRSDMLSEISFLEDSNATKLAALTASGIPAQHAQTYWNAQDALEKNILLKKHEAMRIAHTIYVSNDPNVSYAVPEWLENVEFLKFDTNEENIFALISYGHQGSNEDSFIEFEIDVLNEEGEWEVDIERVPVMLAGFSIDIDETSNNSFDYSVVMAVADSEFTVFSRLLLYLAQLEQKGSVLVNSYICNPDNISYINFTVYMTLIPDMSNYSALIGECPNCNEPYYYADAKEGDYTCTKCKNPIEPRNNN